jgi:hypothetical protein
MIRPRKKEEAEMESDPKRAKLETEGEPFIRPVPPARFKSVTVTPIEEAQYCDSSFQIVELSDGKSYLLGGDICVLKSDGMIDGALTPFECDRFVKIPGYDLIACSLVYYKKYSHIGIFTLPGLKLISTFSFSIRSENDVYNMCADESSSFGIGRFFFSTKYLAYMVDVTKDGHAVIVSCVDMAACAALATLKDAKESYRGLACDVVLYHDPAGNPIAIIISSSGRAVFISMVSDHCVPRPLYATIAESVKTEEERHVNSFFERNSADLENVVKLNFAMPTGLVYPLRILHAHHGRTYCARSQSEAMIHDAQIWQPSTGGGRQLVTVGSDGCIAFSRLDDTEQLLYDGMPYRSVRGTVQNKTVLHHIAIHGDVAFTGSCHEKQGTFWHLMCDNNPVKLCVTEELGQEMRYGKFNIMCAAFSKDGVLALTNSNDCDDPTLSILIPSFVETE